MTPRLVARRPDEWQGHFNYACLLALNGDPRGRRSRELQRAYELDPKEVGDYAGGEDSDLDPIRDDPRVSAIAGQTRRRRRGSVAPAPGRTPAARRRAPLRAPRPRARETSICTPTASANALWARSPPNGTSSSGGAVAGEHVAVRDPPHRDVRDERSPVRARHADRDRVRPGERWAAFGRGEPRRRGRGQRRGQPALGQPAHPVAERAGRKAAGRDDDPRVRGRATPAAHRRSPRVSGSRPRRCRPSARTRSPRARGRAGPRGPGRAAPRASRSARARGSACRGARRRGSGRRASARRPPRTRFRVTARRRAPRSEFSHNPYARSGERPADRRQ